MRTLKLQMQITADGFVAGPNGELDWAMGKMDDKLLEFINHLVDTIDTILLGRKMAPGFISYWEREVAKPGGPQYPFARR
jgi:dihydrofolate reductase